MGVTVLAASGDSGATDGSRSGTATVDFPASSPYVVGCGGTKLTISGAQIGSEVVWDELSANEGATGGGVSESLDFLASRTARKCRKLRMDSLAQAYRM